jgi:hypothetical protein
VLRSLLHLIPLSLLALSSARADTDSLLKERLQVLYEGFAAQSDPLLVLPPFQEFETVARTWCKIQEARSLGMAGSGSSKPGRLAWVDYSVPSDQKRLILYDFEKKRVVARTFATHGGASAGRLHFYEEDPSGRIPYSRRKVLSFGSISEARFFSPEHGSNESSLGVALADRESYVSPLWGDPALRLSGLDGGLNSTLRKRGVVFHSFPYVEEQVLKAKAAPVSEGCLMLPGLEETRKWIEELKGAFVVLYHERLISQDLNEQMHAEDLEVHQALLFEVKKRLHEIAIDFGWDERVVAEKTGFYEQRLRTEWLNRAEETYRLMKKGSRFVGAQLRDETRCFPEVTGKRI